jgi:hypothetical protein
MANVSLTDSQKKAVFVFGVSILLFLLIRTKRKKVIATTNLNEYEKEDNPKDRKKMDMPTLNPKDVQGNEMAKNGFAALKGYISAYNNGEPQSVLDELNREFAKEFKVKVYRRKSDGKLVVCDLSGKQILVNN